MKVAAKLYYALSRWSWINALGILVLTPFRHTWCPLNRVRVALRITNGLKRVLRKGDIAIQCGVCMDRDSSQLLEMAWCVGAGGKVVGIEPDPVNIKRAQELTRELGLEDRVILIPRALSSSVGVASMALGRQSQWNRLQGPAPVSDERRPLFRDEMMEVETTTLDATIRELALPLERIRHINLTINGAEHDGLKGAAHFLEQASACSVSVIAGRAGHDLREVEGRADVAAITDALEARGFETRFSRYFRDGMGYVSGRKGDVPFFW